jgi:RNA recognition motif-containing protein
MAATGELVGGQADAADVLDHANKHSGRHDQLPHSNLYVKGLPASHLDPESVRRLFEAYGGVESVRVVKYERARNTRAFAFVRMTDTAGAAAALGLHGSHLHGAALAVTLADADARDRPQKEGQEPSPCPTVRPLHSTDPAQEPLPPPCLCVTDTVPAGAPQSRPL